MLDQQDTDSGLMGTSLPVPKTPKGMDKEEWLARLELAACYRLVDCYGWTSIVYNHITLRVPGTNDFLINPFGLRYDEITASDLIRIDIDGKKISDSPWPVNEAGYQIHSTIHKNRPDLHCVLHTHEPISQGLGATDAEYVPLTQEGCQLYERVGYHAFEGIVLDGSEGPRIVAALGQRNHTLLLRNHGLITAGPNAVWAFVRHLAFIRNTEVQLAAMSTGRMNVIAPQIMEKTRAQFEGGSAQANALVRHPEWPALIRMIDKHNPDWKQ